MSMARKTSIRLRDLAVKAEDCYDPAEYVLVHQAYLQGLHNAIREAHKRVSNPCMCIYCSPPTQGEKP